MSQPPYYTGAPKKSNVGLIIGIVVVVLLLCCVAPAGILGYFGFGAAKNAMGFMSCGMTMSQLRDAMVAYSKDHEGKLPAAAAWQDDIAKYVKPFDMRNSGGFSLPDPNGDVCDSAAGSSWTFNSDLAGKKLADVKNPYETVALWETAGKGRNKSQKFSAPDQNSGPPFVGNIKRSWVLQPLNGDAYWYNQGMRQSIPNPNDRTKTRSTGINVGTTTG